MKSHRPPQGFGVRQRAPDEDNQAARSGGGGAGSATTTATAPPMPTLHLDEDGEETVIGAQNEAGSASEALETARAETAPAVTAERGPFDKAPLEDFSDLHETFESAGRDAREALTLHLQSGGRADWLAAAEVDFQKHIGDFDRFSFQTLAEEASVRQTVALVASADEAHRVATRSHELQGRVRPALGGDVEVDPEATEEDVHTMQRAVEATGQVPTGMRMREAQLEELLVRVDALRAAHLALGAGLAKRRAALERAKAAAPAGELAEIQATLQAIDTFGGMLQGAVTASIDLSSLSEKAVVGSALTSSAEDDAEVAREDRMPMSPRLEAPGVGVGAESLMGIGAAAVWQAKAKVLQAEITSIEAGARGADDATNQLDLMAAWASVDSAGLGVAAQVSIVAAAGTEQTQRLIGVGRTADREDRSNGRLAVGREGAEGSAERLASVLDAWQQQGAAIQAVQTARANLTTFEGSISASASTEGWSSALSGISERTSQSGARGVRAKVRTLTAIERRLMAQRENLDEAAKGTRALR